MDQAPNLQEPSEQTDDLAAMDQRVADALAGVDDTETTQASAEADVSSREAADLEEKLAAEAISQAYSQSDEMGNVEEERITLIGAAAKGRQGLMDAMRAHQKKLSSKPAYVPAPMTERQLSNREKELEAGRAAQAKAQAQWDSRPIAKPDVRDGSTVPVHRPNNIVPDPILPAGQFAAGTAIYDPSK